RRTQLEFRPFVLGRLRHLDPTPALAGSGTDVVGSAGFDVKWHPSQALIVDAAVFPDFAQVDLDQLVLNLTQFETYYPEQRPFFLEGLEIYAIPMQLVYTRRIGRVPVAPAMRDGEALVDLPQPTPIYLAAKLTGRIGDRWMIGALQAVTQENDVLVQQLSATAP